MGPGAQKLQWILTFDFQLMCKTKISGGNRGYAQWIDDATQWTEPNDLVAQDSNIFRKIFGRVKKSIYEIQSKYQEVGSTSR